LADRAYGKVKEQVEVDFSESLAERIYAALGLRRLCTAEGKTRDDCS